VVKTVKINNVNRVVCEISEHAPLDTLFCTVKTSDWGEYYLGDLKTLYLKGTLQEHIRLQENMKNEIIIDFLEKQKIVCERFGEKLKCQVVNRQGG